jgi:hypothetical protein
MKRDESFTIAFPRCGSDEIQRGCEMSENNTTKSTGRRQRVQANRRNGTVANLFVFDFAQEISGRVCNPSDP